MAVSSITAATSWPFGANWGHQIQLVLVTTTVLVTAGISGPWAMAGLGLVDSASRAPNSASPIAIVPKTFFKINLRTFLSSQLS